jgi:pyrroline-5-carboxylate reductase
MKQLGKVRQIQEFTASALNNSPLETTGLIFLILMLPDMKILIAGGGNMGKTYADSFTAGHVLSREQLYILEHSPEKVEFFKHLGYPHVFNQCGEYIREMDIIILAIKPQDTASLFPQLAPFMHDRQMVLSIMAGVTIKTLDKALPTRKIIRAMPNLPAQIGMGMTGFTSAESVSKEEIFSIQNLLNTTGKSLYFDDEIRLDAVTAISGSGPAYVFFFMESMINAAIHMGFSRTQAEVLVEQTFMGAVHLLQSTHQVSAREWISRVASKGGTTEAALHSFQQNRLSESIENGLQAAHKRAVELGS